MPIIKSNYRAPWYLPSGQLQTIIPARFSRKPVVFNRTTLELEDGDFLDLDWKTEVANDSIIIVTHGLEGSSSSQYIIDLAHQMDASSFDLLAWNCRSCGGRMNRLNKLYHHGEIEDLGAVVQHVLDFNKYKRIYLVGFSMGGNISTKFLARNKSLAQHITRCAIVSTPCDLSAASSALNKPINKILRNYFFKKLVVKLRAKEEQFPGTFPLDKLHEIVRWYDFDDIFVAPYIGYKSASEFYDDASANTFLENVETPLLIINAMNDPILSESCHPRTLADRSEHIYLEISKSGGHVYFPKARSNYAVNRLLNFFNEE